jgi:hypothetical protein
VLSAVALRRAGPVPSCIVLLAGLWLCTPANAQATGLGGVGTTIGLAGALLALLAIHGSAGALAPAASLGVALLALLSAVALAQWRRGRRPAAATRALIAVTPSPHVDSNLVAAARGQFLALQAAWDRADVAALGDLTTAEMLAELLEQLPERGPGPNRTDVLRLDARVLRVERLGSMELASVEFSGMVCESADRGPVPFHELWMLARTGHDGAAWRLARQQALI